MPAKQVTTPAANLALATEYLYGLFGAEVTAMVKREGWHEATRPLVCAYIKSLVRGDGSKPKELSNDAARPVNAIFVEQCSRIIVGHDVLPGQRQDWYKATLAKRRKAQRRVTKVPAPRPSLKLVKEGSIPSRRLQPIG